METKVGMMKKSIASSLTRFGDYLTFTNSSGYTDFNSDAERFFIEILNTTFGCALRELNAEKPNFPAIDLADNRRKICFQVTTTGDNTKFKDTIKTYKKNGFDKVYNELIFLILSADHKVTASDNTVATQVFSLKDLYKKITALSDEDIQYIDSYIKDNLIEKATATNPLKHGINYVLGRANRFKRWSDIEDDELLGEDLKKFAIALSGLTDDQRRYIHFLVSKGHFPARGTSYYDRDDHIILPAPLEQEVYGPRGVQLFNSLKALDLVVLEDEYDQNGDNRYVTAIEPRFRGEVDDFNLFARIRKFLNDDVSKLRRVFLNCDFSCLE